MKTKQITLTKAEYDTMSLLLRVGGMKMINDVSRFTDQTKKEAERTSQKITRLANKAGRILKGHTA